MQQSVFKVKVLEQVQLTPNVAQTILDPDTLQLSSLFAPVLLGGLYLQAFLDILEMLLLARSQNPTEIAKPINCANQCNLNKERQDDLKMMQVWHFERKQEQAFGQRAGLAVNAPYAPRATVTVVALHCATKSLLTTGPKR